MSAERGLRSPVTRRIELFVIVALVVIYGSATYGRNFAWRDEITLWSDVIMKMPSKARPLNNLGREYLNNKAFLQAIPYLKHALRINPYFTQAHYNLGIAYQGIGLYDEAINEYQKALYGAKQLYFANIHNNLGVCYFIKGSTDKAIEEFKQALYINPSFPDAGFNLHMALQRGKKRARVLD
jgi:tetratricopeptide (TPR) repeat protein